MKGAKIVNVCPGYEDNLAHCAHTINHAIYEQFLKQ